MKKIIKEYGDGVALIYRVERNLIDYFYRKEYKNTIILEGMTQEEFIESDKVYEKIIGNKCETEVISVRFIERQDLTDEEIFERLFGNVTKTML